MDSTISTQELKTKLDAKQVTVVETLAPEVIAKPTFPEH